jgi:isopenicillin N synthase-like dioxygenase
VTTQAIRTTTATGADSVVPVIDISGFLTGTADREDVVRAVDAACERVGFMVITGHGVPAELIDRMYHATQRFFAQPTEVKEALASPRGNHYRGYQLPTSFVYSEGGPHDLAEGYEIARYDAPEDLIAAGYGPEWVATYEGNIWPETPADFHAIWREYYGAVETLATQMMNICAAALGLPEGWFDDKFDRHTSYMSANNYWAQVEPPIEGQTRRTAHTDIGSLTILYQDDSPGGLQVLDRSGRWCNVPALPGSFVINLGDLLAKWTNDKWVATEHRVVNPPRDITPSDRISIPYFQHPNFDALIECIPSCTSPENPPKYRSVLAGDWSKYRMTLEN